MSNSCFNWISRSFGFVAMALVIESAAPHILAQDNVPTWSTNTSTPSSDEFSNVIRTVTTLLKTRDSNQFAATMTESIDDWKAVLPTNSPTTDSQERVKFMRRRNESAAQALLARADALHLDFSKGELRANEGRVNQITAAHIPSLGPNGSVPWLERLEITLNPEFATNASQGEFRIAVASLFRFPGGWRSEGGVLWEAFPANVADEKTARELRLLGLVATYSGFDGQDDPALLRLGENLVQFIRHRDIAVYETQTLVSGDLAWAWLQRRGMGDKSPPRQEVEAELAKETLEQANAARAVARQMEDAGIDLKNADIQIKSAAIEGARSQGAGGSIDGLVGRGFKLTLAVKTDAKAKNGVGLSGAYALGVKSLVRLGDNWKITDNLHWAEFPPGVLDTNTEGAVELDNYTVEHGTLPPRTAAPDVQFTTLDGGKKMKLSDLRGKVVVLDFWATWCGPCQEPMAELQKLRTEFPNWGDQVAIVPMSIDDGIEIVRKHVNQRGWTNTLNVWAGEGRFRSEPAAAFRVHGVPTTYVLDKNGRVCQASVGTSLPVGQLVRLLLDNSPPGR